MKKGSRFIFLFLTLILILTIAASFYRFMILKDYIIEAEVDCNPTFESCFISECDIETEECSQKEGENIKYFKYLYKNAANIKQCDSDDPNCDQLTCEVNEIECREQLCTDVSLIEHGLETECASPE